MNARIRQLTLATAFLCLLFAGGCATPPAAPTPAGAAVVAALKLDRALEDRILALDPDHITPDDVKNTLARGPVPRIILVHGGIFPVHLFMESFGEFLTGMGYPEARIRHPGDGRWSHSPYEDSAQIAGFAAWAYEHDGMMPLLIGHSQGGIQVVKVLRELDGAYGDRVSVWNPLTDAADGRTTIEDPLTGKERPVRGLTLSYASAAAAGGAALMLPNQWSMIGNVHTVPDTVEEFTGYSIVFDTWAWTNGVSPDSGFRSAGRARVRNVELPVTYNHVVFPVSSDFPADPQVRGWIEAYTPAAAKGPVPLEAEGRSVLWAADVWFSVRRHWCLEAQRLIRAHRAALGGG
jgi:hypothetical protein